MAGQTRRTGRQAEPCSMVIFGAAGDLTSRLLLPALYNLDAGNLLAPEFKLVGIARAEKTDEQFREELQQSLHQFASDTFNEKAWNDLAPRITYVRGNFDDDAAYQQLIEHLGGLDEIRNVLFYLATAPEYFAPIVERLAACKLAEQRDGVWRRVIIEKPFGHDLESAKALNQKLLSFLTEQQIYRIDHYLGKETVQNIMVFRFANGIYEPLWNRDHIDHVQITVAETVGVETRGNFYDHTGALRDMVPNHLFPAPELHRHGSADLVRRRRRTRREGQGAGFGPTVLAGAGAARHGARSVRQGRAG